MKIATTTAIATTIAPIHTTAKRRKRLHKKWLIRLWVEEVHYRSGNLFSSTFNLANSAIGGMHMCVCVCLHALRS